MEQEDGQALPRQAAEDDDALTDASMSEAEYEQKVMNGDLTATQKKPRVKTSRKSLRQKSVKQESKQK